MSDTVQTDSSEGTGKWAYHDDEALGAEVSKIYESKTPEEWRQLNPLEVFNIDPKDAADRQTHAARKLTVGAFRAMENVARQKATEEDINKVGVYMDLFHQMAEDIGKSIKI